MIKNVKVTRIKTKRQTTPEKIIDASRNLYNFGLHGTEIPPFDLTSIWDKYHSWAFRASNLNARAVASTPLRMYMRNPKKIEARIGKKLDWKPNTERVPDYRKAYLRGESQSLLGDTLTPSPWVQRKVSNWGADFLEITDNHPILTLLDNVNPLLDGYDFVLNLMTHLQMSGNAYVHPIYEPGTTIVKEIYLLKPRYVEIEPYKEDEDKNKWIKGYWYARNEIEKKFFAEDEIWQMKNVEHPKSDLYGMGYAEAAWNFLVQYEMKQTMDLTMFKNLGYVALLVSIKDAQEDQLHKFEKKWNKNYRGAANQFKTAFLGGEVDVKPVPFPDLKPHVAIEESLIRSIGAVFGIPEPKLLSNDPNRANATAGDYNWQKDEILPWLRKLEDFWNHRLVPAFGLENDVVLAYDNPVPIDRNYELQRKQISVGGSWKTINEARIEDGLAPVENGDVIISLKTLEQTDATKDVVEDMSEQISPSMPTSDIQMEQDELAENINEAENQENPGKKIKSKRSK